MANLEIIRKNMGLARLQSPLAAPDAVILGASKGQPSALLESIIQQGLMDFGENRVQEAENKWPALKKAYPQVRLHLIGPLQTNKVKEAISLFDVIQTLDRPKLAEVIAKEKQKGGVTKEFFIQVNTGEEPQKAGCAPHETTSFLKQCKELGLNVVGLMCIPPANEMAAPHFALLRKLAHENNLKKLSMGMSEDYETAIRMGSTCIRIGRALFGERQA